MAHDRPGYDAPARTRGEDELDRWRFAADIVETITATPPDWAVRRAAFSPDGARIVTASEDNTARVYFLRFDDLLRVAKERLPITPPAYN